MCARGSVPSRGVWGHGPSGKFRSSEIDSSAFLCKKCKYLGMFQKELHVVANELIQLYISCRKTDALAAIASRTTRMRMRIS